MGEEASTLPSKVHKVEGSALFEVDSSEPETPLVEVNCFIQDSAIKGYGLPNNQVSPLICHLHVLL